MRIHVEWAASRTGAVRRAEELRRRACPEVEAVEVVDHCSGERIFYRTIGEELVAS